MLNIDWTVVKLLYIPILIISQVLFFGSLFIIGATTTFWTMERLEILNIFTYGGSEIMSYPMHIFPRPIRLIFTYLVPAIFMSYFPAVYILDKPDPLNAPGIVSFLAPFVASIMLWLALRFWHFGIRNYQSSGS
jgi:ABC-2 type transport system permease protein